MADVKLNVLLTGADTAATDLEKVVDVVDAAGKKTVEVSVDTSSANVAKEQIGEVIHAADEAAGKSVELEVSAPGAPEAAEELTELTDAAQAVPEKIEVEVTAPEATIVRDEIVELIAQTDRLREATDAAAAADRNATPAKKASADAVKAMGESARSAQDMVGGLNQSMSGGLNTVLGLTRAWKGLVAALKAGTLTLGGWIAIASAAITVLVALVGAAVRWVASMRDGNRELRETERRQKAAAEAARMHRQTLIDLEHADLGAQVQRIQEMADGYARAADQAERLFQANQALEDAQTQTVLAQLKLEEEKAVAAAAPESRPRIRAEKGVERAAIVSAAERRKLAREEAHRQTELDARQGEFVNVQAEQDVATQIAEENARKALEDAAKARAKSTQSLPVLPTPPKVPELPETYAGVDMGPGESVNMYLRARAAEQAKAIGKLVEDFMKRFAATGAGAALNERDLGALPTEALKTALSSTDTLLDELQKQDKAATDPAQKKYTEAFVQVLTSAMEVLKAEDAYRGTVATQDEALAKQRREAEVSLAKGQEAMRQAQAALDLARERRRAAPVVAEATAVSTAVDLADAQAEEAKAQKENRKKELDTQIKNTPAGRERYRLEAEKAGLEGDAPAQRNAQWQEDVVDTAEEVGAWASRQRPGDMASGYGSRDQARVAAALESLRRIALELQNGDQGKEAEQLLAGIQALADSTKTGNTAQRDFMTSTVAKLREIVREQQTLARDVANLKGQVQQARNP